MHENLISLLSQIAHGVAAQFGSDCEVVIHDLNRVDNSVTYIENNHVSGRQLGDGPSHVVLDALRQDPAKLNDRLSYMTRTHDGKLLKSSTMFIRDEEGVVCAIFAINYDITSLLAFESKLKSMIATSPVPTGEEESAPDEIHLNVNDLLDELINQSIKLIGKPAASMTKDEKIRAIKFLSDSGAFLITKSGDKISNVFNVSKYTLYSYINAAAPE